MRRLLKILTSLCSGIRRGKGACLDLNNTESKLYTIHCILSIIELLLCLVHWFLRNLHDNRGLSKKTSSILLSRYKEICLSLCWLVGPLLRWHSKAKTTVQPWKFRVLGFNRIILICFTQPQLIFFAKHGQLNYFFMRWNGAKYEGSVLD